jgi:hypothetical protein
LWNSYYNYSTVWEELQVEKNMVEEGPSLEDGSPNRRQDYLEEISHRELVEKEIQIIKHHLEVAESEIARYRLLLRRLRDTTYRNIQSSTDNGHKKMERYRALSDTYKKQIEFYEILIRQLKTDIAELENGLRTSSL